MFKRATLYLKLTFVALILFLLLSPFGWIPCGIIDWITADRTMTFTKTMQATIALTCVSGFGVIVSYILCKKFKSPYFPSLKYLFLIFGLGTLTTLTYNHYIYEVPWMIPAAIFSGLAVICFSYAVLRWGALLFWGPMLIISTLQIICWYLYGSKLNAFMLQETLHANTSEIITFLTPLNCTIAIGGLLLVVLICYLIYKLCSKISSATLLMTGACSLLFYSISCILMPPGNVHICAFWPMFEIRNTHQIFGMAQAQEARILQRIENLPSPADFPFEITNVTPNDGIVCILHIGESVRADRLGINGWKNNTTPRMAARNELINFSKCISVAPSTCAAFVGILTNGTGNIQQEQEDSTLPTTGSILDFFTTNGFSTAVFVHSQNVPSREDMKLTTKSFDSTFAEIFEKLTSKVNDRFYINNKSMEQHLQIVDYCKQNPKKNLFLLVNNMGSHGPFADYDWKNPTFTPSNHTSFYSNAEMHAEAVSNAYDNTIAYQDELIGRICDSLKGRPFIYIYVSDHGELMGEDGMWSRAALPSDEVFFQTQACVVPLFIAYSQEFSDLKPHFKESLSSLKANSTLTIGQGHIFHTILGLFGIRTEFYNRQLDLCSPQAIPYTGKSPLN